MERKAQSFSRLKKYNCGEFALVAENVMNLKVGNRKCRLHFFAEASTHHVYEEIFKAFPNVPAKLEI